jgi:hypothetical protein
MWRQIAIALFAAFGLFADCRLSGSYARMRHRRHQ